MSLGKEEISSLNKGLHAGFFVNRLKPFCVIIHLICAGRVQHSVFLPTNCLCVLQRLLFGSSPVRWKHGRSRTGKI